VCAEDPVEHEPGVAEVLAHSGPALQDVVINTKKLLLPHFDQTGGFHASYFYIFL
jgi:hypothetical protein